MCGTCCCTLGHPHTVLNLNTQLCADGLVTATVRPRPVPVDWLAFGQSAHVYDFADFIYFQCFVTLLALAHAALTAFGIEPIHRLLLSTRLGLKRPKSSLALLRFHFHFGAWLACSPCRSICLESNRIDSTRTWLGHIHTVPGRAKTLLLQLTHLSRPPATTKPASSISSNPQSSAVAASDLSTRPRSHSHLPPPLEPHPTAPFWYWSTLRFTLQRRIVRFSHRPIACSASPGATLSACADCLPSRPPTPQSCFRHALCQHI